MSAALLFAAIRPASAGDRLLELMAGDWIGRGAGRLAEDSPSEPIYCRFANVLAPDGLGIAQTGRCAFGVDTVKIAGRIVADGNGGYSGSWTSPLTDAPAIVDGARIDDRVVLIGRATAGPTGEAVESTIAFDLGQDGQYVMTTHRNVGADGSYLSSRIVFTREP